MPDYGMLDENPGETSLGQTRKARMPTLKNRLDAAVQEAKDRLKEAERAREIFNQHPELEELLNIMQKGRF